ncbi:C-type mannose receptor 2-like, partial [Carassius carassius]|uniref:C-type mannose receptor 2-like n=1 Tax=Carassius carassius TaxID=217509 RepID=UPI002868F1DC
LEKKCKEIILSFRFSKGNSGYILVKSLKTWRDAQSYCRQHYTDLPTIRNISENNQINQILLSGYYIWIGLFFDSWEWSDKWSRVFRHWAADQPFHASGSGDCVAMARANSGKWAQYSCDLKQPFICYRGERFQYIYHYINVRMSWPEAQSYCRSKYTDLATVDSMDDVNRLVNIVDAGYSGSVWIGLKRGTQTRWVWSNGDGTVTQYSPWSAGHPISQNECGYFNFGVWTLGNGLINGVAPSDTGQQINHPSVQDLVTVLACQEPILGNGLNTAVISSSLLSAMVWPSFNLNSITT